MSEKMVLMSATDSSEKIPCVLSVGVTMLTDDGCSTETEGRLSGSHVSETPPNRSIRSCKVSHSVGSPKEVAGTGRLSCKKSFFNLSYTYLGDIPFSSACDCIFARTTGSDTFLSSIYFSKIFVIFFKF